MRVADREGFEPSIEFPLYTRSRRAPSTTRPPVRIHGRGSPAGSGPAGGALIRTVGPPRQAPAEAPYRRRAIRPE